MKKISQFETLKIINHYPLLQKGFAYFINHNTGISNPYHNITHTMAMLQLVNEYIAESGYNGDREKLLLLTLFHDYNHSGGKYSDDTNVENAISGLEHFLKENGLTLTKEQSEALWDTCFPYKGETKSIEGRILRECDNLQWTFDDFFTQTLIGLKTELNVSIFETAIRRELEFVEESAKHLTLKYTTTVAQQYLPELRDYCDELLKTI